MQVLSDSPLGTATASGHKKSMVEKGPVLVVTSDPRRAPDSRILGTLSARPGQEVGGSAGGALASGGGRLGLHLYHLPPTVNRSGPWGLLLQAWRRVTSEFPGASRPGHQVPRSLHLMRWPRGRDWPGTSLPRPLGQEGLQDFSGGPWDLVGTRFDGEWKLCHGQAGRPLPAGEERSPEPGLGGGGGLKVGPGSLLWRGGECSKKLSPKR